MDTKMNEKVNLTSIVTIAFVVIASLMVLILSYVINVRFQTNNYEEVLETFLAHKWLHATETLFNLLMGVCIIPAYLGIYCFLKKMLGKQKLTGVLVLPLTTTIIGAAVVIGLYCLKFYLLFELAKDYGNAATAAEKTAIYAYFLQLLKIANLLSVVAYLCIYTLGAGVTSIITLKTAAVKSNASWWGMLAGLLALGVIGSFMENTAAYVLSLAASIGSIMYFIWLSYYFIELINYQKELRKGFYEMSPEEKQAEKKSSSEKEEKISL